MLMMIILSACNMANMNMGRAPAGNVGNHDKGDFVIELISDTATLSTGDTELMVSVKDKQGKVVDDAIVTVNADMTMMSHGGISGKMQAKGGGKYSIRARFSMAGPWLLTVTLDKQGLPQGIKEIALSVK